jgi:hypothetical protein
MHNPASQGPAILSREWDWAEQTKRLKAREAYES